MIERRVAGEYNIAERRGALGGLVAAGLRGGRGRRSGSAVRWTTRSRRIGAIADAFGRRATPVLRHELAVGRHQIGGAQLLERFGRQRCDTGRRYERHDWHVRSNRGKVARRRYGRLRRQLDAGRAQRCQRHVKVSRSHCCGNSSRHFCRTGGRLLSIVVETREILSKKNNCVFYFSVLFLTLNLRRIGTFSSIETPTTMTLFCT
jgi:hypothetical protein